MSENKLKKIYNLPKNLYTSGSPIIIAEGGLYRDEEGCIFAGLRMKDVEAKEISSFKVLVKTFDKIWKPIGKDYEFSFTQTEDQENFSELANPHQDLYAIDAVVSEVKFKDGSTWESGGEQWVPLEDSDIEDGSLFKPEVLEERRRLFAEKQNRI